jgi:MFS superfamily sulfate permease-like transporter
MFGTKVRELAEDDPNLQWIIVAAEPITDVDTTASDMLQELDAWLNTRGISLVFAEMKDPVRAKIERYELTRTIDPRHFLPTLDEAVAEYVRQTGATWRDPGTVRPSDGNG